MGGPMLAGTPLQPKAVITSWPGKSADTPDKERSPSALECPPGMKPVGPPRPRERAANAGLAGRATHPEQPRPPSPSQYKLEPSKA